MPPTVQETAISDEELRNFDLKALVIKGGDYTIFPDVQVRNDGGNSHRGLKITI